MNTLPLTVQQATEHLLVFKSKGQQYEEAVRILDQCERDDCMFGERMAIQVKNYATGEWLLVASNSASPQSIATCYRLIRIEMEWDGPIRVAVAISSRD